MPIYAASNRASPSKMKETVAPRKRSDPRSFEKDASWTSLANGSESDHVAEKIFGDLPIAVAAESECIVAIRNRDHRDDRLREILASIAHQQVALRRRRRVDLPHLFRI